MEQDLITLDNNGGDGELDLAGYAQRAYLEYALSVVKGRALPDVADGHPAHPAVGRWLRPVVVGDDGLGSGFAQGPGEPADGARHAAVTDQRPGVVVHDPHERPGGRGAATRPSPARSASTPPG